MLNLDMVNHSARRLFGVLGLAIAFAAAPQAGAVTIAHDTSLESENLRLRISENACSF